MLIVAVSLGSSAVFRWRRQSCPDDEGRSWQLGHGDILVMDGRCQDEFLHRTSPGREQDRINITFRWVEQHVSSWHAVCQRVRRVHQFLLWGMLFMAFFFLVFWFLLGVLCIWGVLAWLVSLFCTRLGLLRCASCWTRPLGGGRWGITFVTSGENT